MEKLNDRTRESAIAASAALAKDQVSISCMDRDGLTVLHFAQGILYLLLTFEVTRHTNMHT